MRNTPLFSVLMANYNNGQFIQESIESIIKQSYTQWEIIIVDDASTDNSAEVYKEYENDTRIKVYYNETNQGCGYTKNKCADIARGELCGFLDPDDALIDDALDVMVSAHLQNPDVSTVGSCYWACDENLKPNWHSLKRDVKEGYSYLTNLNHAPIHFASYKNGFYASSKKIDSKLKRAVDLDLYLKLEETAPIIFIDNITYYYRLHNNNISTSGDFKGLFWHSLVITNACNRRKIEPDIIFNELLKKNLDWYIKNYMNVSQLQAKPTMYKRIKRKIKQIIFRS